MCSRLPQNMNMKYEIKTPHQVHSRLNNLKTSQAIKEQSPQLHFSRANESIHLFDVKIYQVLM